MQEFEVFFSIVVLIFSVVVHEVAHGYTADWLGDPTAKFAGRLTLNPLKHLSLLGSVIVPAITYFTGGFIFGWAKPVPYNPYNIKRKHGDALVALAGPASNLFIAFVFGLLMRFGAQSDYLAGSFKIFATIVFINIILAVFNLVPIPPLDGSKILFSLTSYSHPQIGEFLEKNGMVLLVIFLLFFWKYLLPLVGIIFSSLTGIKLA